VTDAQPAADLYDGRHLEARDPNYIRGFMPILEFGYRHYFRVQAYGLHNLPVRGPALLIGNHSGGLVAPDAAMTLYLWVRERGLEQPAYALIHAAVFSLPEVRSHVARCGGLQAHPKAAMEALDHGGVVLLYPGGADDAYRPYSRRHEVELAGNKGFIKLALARGLPIVPIVTTAHDTVIVLDDGKELARELGAAKHGLDRLPITLSMLGISVGPSFHVPFPVPFKIAVGSEIRFRDLSAAAAKDRAIVSHCYEVVRQEMQSLLNGLVG
jgi:1-acyl-sn-glycerol-3-phosphate acyltransferase